MPCAFCGEGDRWIKTCRTKDGSRIRVCDPCWEVLSPWLVIVPGDETVTARCQRCRRYFNPREMAEVSPGGRHSTYSGTCGACAEESACAIGKAVEGTVEETVKERSYGQEGLRLYSLLQGILVGRG